MYIDRQKKEIERNKDISIEVFPFWSNFALISIAFYVRMDDDVKIDSFVFIGLGVSRSSG